MQTSPPDFVDSFRRHLVLEQRRAVLEVLASELDPEITIGEVIEAAEDLGWMDGIGDLCLAELAEALITDLASASAAPSAAAAAPAIADEDDEASDDEDAEAATDEADADAADEDEDQEEEEEEVAPAPARAIPKAKMGAKKASKAAAAKKASKAAPAKKAAKAPAKSSKKAAAAAIPAAKKASKKAAKAAPKASKKAPPIDDSGDEAMSMEQAAKALLPIVRKLKEATMQDLEEKTGMGRRKLRFHIGQLVKHNRLRRHGMGRGTYYTVVR